MKKQARLAGILVALLLAGAVTVVSPAFAEEDEGEDQASERAGEVEFEDDDSEEAAISGGLSGLVLYGVIAAVLGTIGYTAYKIFAGRKGTSVPARP